MAMPKVTAVLATQSGLVQLMPDCSGGSHQSLPAKVFECPLAHDVALDVLALNVLVRPEGLLLCVTLELLVQGDGILYLGDLLEVALEGPTPPVRVVPADFAFVFDAQPMELVQPEGDWFPVPAERQIQRVVNRPLLVCIPPEVRAHVHAIVQHFIVIIAVIFVILHLLGSLALLLLEVLDGLCYCVAEEVMPLCCMTLQPC